MTDEMIGDRDLDWYREHQPKKLVGEPEAGKLCVECNVTLAATALAYHKKNDHAFFKCPVCGGNIRRWDITIGRYKLCSIICQVGVYKKDICRECFKKPITLYSWCDDCRKKYGARTRARYGMYREIGAVREAHQLPKPYRREDADQA